MRLLCVLALLLVLPMTACGPSPSSAAPAEASQPPPAPTGWVSGPMQGGFVIMSPEPDQAQRVVLTLLPVVQPQAPVKDWFGNQALALAQSFGKVEGATETQEQGAILSRAVKMNANGRELKSVFVGYASPHGFQMSVVMMPASTAEADPRVETISNYLDQLQAAHFDLTPPPQTQAQTQPQGPTGPAGPPPAAMPTPADGAQLMALIPPLGAANQPMYPRPGDPIMQPRPQLPPDRDIPIKGAYFMTGIAFGAVNAGVGGSAYGSHAVQQLLILYANGVAVKADIFGNNLAGHHQAEGFATLDVTDPNVVGQGGFGRWSQQGQTISINWNYAQPEVLTVDGNSLEGGGVKYNPWRLADGVRLEGVFVRPNDPGLRGQAIVLTQNGLFAADGVNVTMGAELVMPYFPARGYGTYEIKKGSLVLHFANGFNVAIACNIDGATLLLNNFGYQRAR